MLSFFRSILFISLIVAGTAKASIYLDIRIFSTTAIKKCNIEIFAGKYLLLDSAGTSICELYKESAITVLNSGGNVMLIKDMDTLAVGPELSIKGVGFLNIFRITPLNPSLQERYYDDDIKFLPDKDGKLMLINHVELEHYIAGVVQAEVGSSSKFPEFYKVQAVSARTFALMNAFKHISEGFHMCDVEHCQAYKGRCNSTTIMLATSQTMGEVMVDDNGDLIFAAFHSNSGGQTANSEDVWSRPLPYLRSVNDSFSIGMPNYSWKKVIPRIEWLNYFQRTYNYNIEDAESRGALLNFQQISRKVYICPGIPLKAIRNDFNLKSTFFSVSESGDKVVLTGKGYGHGVGMSQEGAMKMAQFGYSYTQILLYYYKGITFIQINDLKNKPFQ